MTWRKAVFNWFSPICTASHFHCWYKYVYIELLVVVCSIDQHLTSLQGMSLSSDYVNKRVDTRTCQTKPYIMIYSLMILRTIASAKPRWPHLLLKLCFSIVLERDAAYMTSPPHTHPITYIKHYYTNISLDSFSQKLKTLPNLGSFLFSVIWLH